MTVLVMYVCAVQFSKSSDLARSFEGRRPAEITVRSSFGFGFQLRLLITNVTPQGILNLLRNPHCTYAVVNLTCFLFLTNDSLPLIVLHIYVDQRESLRASSLQSLTPFGVQAISIPLFHQSSVLFLYLKPWVALPRWFLSPTGT